MANTLFNLNADVRQMIYNNLLATQDEPGTFNVIAYWFQIPPHYLHRLLKPCSVTRPDLLLDTHSHGPRGMPCEFRPFPQATGYVAVAPRSHMLNLALTCKELSEEVLTALYRGTKICIFGTVLARTNLPSASDILRMFLANIPEQNRQNFRHLEVASEGHPFHNMAATSRVHVEELRDLCDTITVLLPGLRTMTLAIDFEHNFPHNGNTGYHGRHLVRFGILASRVGPRHLTTYFRRNPTNNRDVTQNYSTVVSDEEETRYAAKQEALREVLNHVKALVQRRVAQQQWALEIEEQAMELTLPMRSRW